MSRGWIDRGGSGIDGVSASDFVGEDGSIAWNDLASTIASVIVLVFWYGPIQLILAASEAWTRVIDGLAVFAADYVSAVVGTPGAVVSGAWGQAETFVEGSGLAGYLVALAIVLLTMYIVSRGVQRVK